MIGQTYVDTDGRTWTVKAFWGVSDAYVLVWDGYQEELRRASDVRRRLELDRGAA